MSANMMPMPNDQYLVEQTLNGDQQAFAELVTLYHHAVYNLAYHMLGDAREAEDAAQGTFTRAFNNLHKYDTSRPLKTWLLSIVSHYAIDLIRRWKRLAWSSLDEMETETMFDGGEPTPEEVMMRVERNSRLGKMLQKLSADCRAMVVMHYWDGMSYEEIAVALGTNEGAVKSRSYRARQKLADGFRTADRGTLVTGTFAAVQI